MEDQSSLVAIIVLMLGSAFSPVVFSLSVMAVGSKKKPIEKGLGYFVGALIVAFGLAVIANYISINSVEAGFSDNPILKNIDLALGILLIGFGVWTIIPRKPKKDTEKAESHHEKNVFFSWLILGFVMVLTNADNGLMYFSGIREIANSDTDLSVKIIGEIVASVIFLLPVLLPLFFAIFFPTTSQKVLAPVLKFLKKYGKYIVAIILIGIGIYLILR